MRYREPVDKPVQTIAQLPARATRSSLVSGVQACSVTSPDLGSTKTSACADHRASQSPPPRTLRKVAGSRDIKAIALQNEEQDIVEQQRSSPACQSREASPPATDVHAENALGPKRWFTIRRKRKPKENTNSNPPKSSAESSLVAEKDPIDAKEPRFNNRPRNKLRKVPPSKPQSQETKKNVKSSKYRQKRRGLHIRFRKSKRSPRADIPRPSRKDIIGGFHLITSDVGEGSEPLTETVVSDAVTYNFGAAPASKARDLARRWLEAGRAKPGTLDEYSHTAKQGHDNTGRQQSEAVGEGAESSLTDVDNVQLQAEARPSGRKVERRSRFKEHLSDSDDDDIDIDDYSMLNGSSTSNITEQISRFLAPKSYREELVVLNPDDPRREEARYIVQQHQKEIDHYRCRGSIGMRREDVFYPDDAPRLPATRGRPSRHQLGRVATFQHARRSLMSPIPEQPSPSPSQVPSTPELMSLVPDLITKQDPSTPATSDDSSGYVSSISASTTTTERFTIAEEAETGIATSWPFTKVFVPELRTVDVARPKGKQRQDRVDTPMVAQNGVLTPGFQTEDMPWWEQAPREPKAVPKFACGPSVAVQTSSSRVKAERPRALTPEAGILLRRTMAIPKPPSPRVCRFTKGKRTSLAVGRPGLAADLEFKSKCETETVAQPQRQKSVSERAVGLHLPVQEPVDIPREELERILRGW